MKFNEPIETHLLCRVLDYHADEVMNNEDDHDETHVIDLYKLLDLIKEKKNEI